jgi:hypothetical protein
MVKRKYHHESGAIINNYLCANDCSDFVGFLFRMLE